MVGSIRGGGPDPHNQKAPINGENSAQKLRKKEKKMSKSVSGYSKNNKIFSENIEIFLSILPRNNKDNLL